MARRLLFMNVLMLIATVVLAQQLMALWAEFSGRSFTLPEVGDRVLDGEIPDPMPRVDPLSRFLVVSERNLFSVDRTVELVAEDPEEEQAPEIVREPQLISIFAMGGEKEAVMNVFEGRRGTESSQRNVKMGDNLLGYTVTRIEDTYLVMAWRDQELVINLSPPGQPQAARTQAARQAVNIITIGTAGAAVETTTASTVEEQARGLEVATVGGRGSVTGMAGQRGGMTGTAGQRGGMTGMAGSQGQRMGGTSSMGRGMTSQGSFGGALGSRSTMGQRRPIR